MPVFAHLSDDGTYIVVDITGGLTTSLAQWALPEVVSLIQTTHIDKLLIDARERSLEFSYIDRYEIGELMAIEPAFRQVYFAVVVRDALAEASLGRQRGADIRYFNDYSQAVAWLQTVSRGQQD
jgi:hypothetical protein